MAKIKKGDLVQVISGPSQARGGDRGKQGRVIEVLVDQNRVVVEGINYVTKHVRVGQTQRGTKPGGIETHEAPIHISNVAVVDPKTKKPTRVGFREEVVEKNGVKKTVRVRYAKIADMTMAFFNGDVIGVANRGKVQAVVLLGLLAGGNRLGARYAAK